MIAPDKEGKIGCETGTTVVLVEVAYGSVFLRHGHAIEIVAVTDCLSLSNKLGLKPGGKANLEVTANNKEIYVLPLVYLTGFLDRGIDGVKSAVALFLRQLDMTSGYRQSSRNPRLQYAACVLCTHPYLKTAAMETDVIENLEYLSE